MEGQRKFLLKQSRFPLVRERNASRCLRSLSKMRSHCMLMAVTVVRTCFINTDVGLGHVIKHNNPEFVGYLGWVRPSFGTRLYTLLPPRFESWAVSSSKANGDMKSGLVRWRSHVFVQTESDFCNKLRKALTFSQIPWCKNKENKNALSINAFYVRLF